MTLIVQCSEQKGEHPCEAYLLYKSQLFRKARDYAIWSGHPWRIFSAYYGLISPDRITGPYDIAIGNAQSIHPERLRLQLPEGRIVSLCSKPYNTLLTRAGCVYEDPLKGLYCGQRKMWFLKRLVL